MSEVTDPSGRDSRGTATVIRDFIFQRFPLARRLARSDTDSLLDAGIVDSLGILEIVGFLSEEFGIAISDEDLTPDNFGSVASLVGFVESKRES